MLRVGDKVKLDESAQTKRKLKAFPYIKFEGKLKVTKIVSYTHVMLENGYEYNNLMLEKTKWSDVKKKCDIPKPIRKDKKKCDIPKPITQKEWNDKKKHGYAHIENGIKYILTWNNGTCLQPVIIKKQQ